MVHPLQERDVPFHQRVEPLVGVRPAGPRRLDLLPGVATMSETLPGVEVVNWYGAILPRATPKEIVGRLHAEMISAMNTPDA